MSDLFFDKGLNVETRRHRGLKKITLCLCASVFLIFTACDSGDIYPDEPENPSTGSSVEATFTFEGLDAFPEDNYQLIFGLFENTKASPVTSVRIMKPKEGKPVKVSLSNIPENATKAKLCLREVGKNPVYSFFEVELTGKETSGVSIGEKTVNLLQYNRIQQVVFDQYQCLSCHGSGKGAGNLLLSTGNSYTNLVNKETNKMPGMLRVKPYNVDNSFLIHALTDPGTGLSTPHTGFVYREDDIALLKAWIKEGAEQVK